MIWTGDDFGDLCWHDNPIHGITLAVDDSQWKSDLVLDIDYILEWLCDADGSGRCRFWLAPALLTFHDVTDPRISVDWGNSGFQVSMHLISIDAIYRERVEKQKICLDRPYYRWRIATNWPDGEMAFGATGFTMTLRGEPLLSEQQSLSPSQRGG